MTGLCWTEEHRELLCNLVRRYAFDFDAASPAFEEHLQHEDAPFDPQDTSPATLRKEFAKIYRSQKPPACTPLDASRSKPPTKQAVNGVEDEEDVGSNTFGHTLNGALSDEHTGQTSTTGVKRFNRSAWATSLTSQVLELDNVTPRRPFDQPGDVDIEYAGAANVLEPSSPWSFDAFLRDQEQKELQHEARKEQTFQRVLSALGGPTKIETELPPDVLLAWESRKDKKTPNFENDQRRKRELEEDHELALQREVLQGRYLPESHYYGGEDTLGTTPDKTLTIHQRQNNFAASAGPVELKLGINSEELERVLSELEGSANASGHRETATELSQVLDVLDDAAGDISARHLLPIGNE